MSTATGGQAFYYSLFYNADQIIIKRFQMGEYLVNTLHYTNNHQTNTLSYKVTLGLL